MHRLLDSKGRIKEEWIGGECSLHVSYINESPPYVWEGEAPQDDRMLNAAIHEVASVLKGLIVEHYSREGRRHTR